MNAREISTVMKIRTWTAVMLHYLKEILGAAPWCIPASSVTPATATLPATVMWTAPTRHCSKPTLAAARFKIPARCVGRGWSGVSINRERDASGRAMVTI